MRSGSRAHFICNELLAGTQESALNSLKQKRNVQQKKWCAAASLTPLPSSVRLQFSTALFRILIIASGAPMIGENREAGEIPARSRHCDVLEAAGY